MKQFLSILLLALFILSAIAGCAAPTVEPTEEPAAGPVEEEEVEPTEVAAPAEQPVIKIGAAISLTGALANLGVNLQDGYDFWVDAVNEMGGIQIGDEKYLVEIVYYDDASDAETSVRTHGKTDHRR